jgi:hypothetical protein
LPGRQHAVSGQMWTFSGTAVMDKHASWADLTQGVRPRTDSRRNPGEPLTARLPLSQLPGVPASLPFHLPV